MLTNFYITFLGLLTFSNIFSNQEQELRQNFILKLHEIGAIKFGKFTLKSGIESSYYIDLRLIISYPKMLKQAANLISQKIKSLDFDVICPVPYGAIPVATATSILTEKPLVMHRKEQKDHGTKKLVEGTFKNGDSCLVIEDVVTSGTSILESIKILEKEFKIKHIAFLIDREQGGKQRLENLGYNVVSIFSINEIIQVLTKFNKIDTN
ncbi:orotate phosphoribosyltransferase [Candidatus Dependentiae bacterium]|nr:orotate phosphoribosyltransferase [Candidatus Dependentiae bacterium]